VNPAIASDAAATAKSFLISTSIKIGAANKRDVSHLVPFGNTGEPGALSSLSPQ
jgi:hypothetical protein